MAAFSWTTGTSGVWNTATNWTPGTIPNDPAADVTIDALAPAGGSYTVTLAAGTSDTVNSLSINGVINKAGSNSSPYNAAELELDGTLAFAPGSLGRLDGSLQTFVHVGFLNGASSASIVNAGTIDAFIQVEGNLLITGTNGVYITNDLQALSGTVTIDTTAINEMTGNTLFDGIFDSKGPGAVIDLGGAQHGLVVNIGTIEGPPLVPGGWTELTFNDPTAVINEWQGAAYVGVETTLTDIKGGGTVDVLVGRNYTTALALTVEAAATAGGLSGMFNLQAGTVTTGGININGGIVQGSGTIRGGVANNGTLIALSGTVAGTLDLTGSLTGTGAVRFDFDNKTGTVSSIGATLEVNSVSAGQTIVMNGADTLQLDTPAAFAGTIDAGIGDKIVLTGLTATSAVLNNGTLVVSNGAQTLASLKLAGPNTGDSFTANGSIVTIGSASAVSHFTITDTTTSATTTDLGTAYTGPVAGLDWQFITVTPDSLAITATVPNSFIHSGSGNDAIDVSHVNGTNVLDGSTGSNFLVGGTGFDTFFVDDRNASADIFSTVANFHSGDNATVFGVTAANFTNTFDNQGAVGFLGLDFSFTAPGKANANLVLAGFTKADLTSGKLTVSFGTTADTPGVPGSTFMLIHDN